MIAIVPLLVAVVGLVIYFASTTNAKLAEVGRLLFACGALVTLIAMMGRVVKVF